MWKMYILITEDGAIYQVDSITAEDMRSSDDGMLDIIAVPDMTQYNNGEWHEIQGWAI